MIGSSASGVTNAVYVKDGKIVGIRPLNYEMNRDAKDFILYRIEGQNL